MFKKITLKNWSLIKSKAFVFYYDPVNDSEYSKFIEDNLDKISDFFYKKRMEFCYLPEISRSITKEQIKYRHPDWMGEPLSSVGNNALRNYLPDTLQNEACLIRCVEFSDKFYYYQLKPFSKNSFEDQIEEFCNKIAKDEDNIRFCVDDGIRFSISRKEVSEKPGFEKTYCLADEEFDTMDFNIEISAFIKQLKLRGVEEFVLKCMVPIEDKPSKLVVTPQYDILLPDYDNMKIEMSPLPKAIFLLFLKHEDGIYFKELSDYKDELQEIYSKISNRVDDSVIAKSIEQITDPTKNAINEKCSRIREAFLNNMDNALAEQYYMTGNKGEKKRITLPRTLVEWQCDI